MLTMDMLKIVLNAINSLTDSLGKTNYILKRDIIELVHCILESPDEDVTIEALEHFCRMQLIEYDGLRGYNVHCVLDEERDLKKSSNVDESLSTAKEQPPPATASDKETFVQETGKPLQDQEVLLLKTGRKSGKPRALPIKRRQRRRLGKTRAVQNIPATFVLETDKQESLAKLPQTMTKSVLEKGYTGEEQSMPQTDQDPPKKLAGRKSRKPSKARALPKKRRQMRMTMSHAGQASLDSEAAGGEPSAQKQIVLEGRSTLLPNVRSHIGYKYNTGRRTLCRNCGRISMKKVSKIDIGLINQDQSGNGLDSEQSVTQAEQDAPKNQTAGKKSHKPAKSSALSKKRRYAEQNISEESDSEADGEEPSSKVSQMSQAGDSLECQFQRRRTQKQKVREGSSALLPKVSSHLGYKYNPGRRTLCRNCGRISMKKESRMDIGVINQDQSANGLDSEQSMTQDEPDAPKNQRDGGKSRKPAKPRPLPKKRRHAEQNIPAASVLEADREEPSAKLSQAGDSLERQYQRRRAQKQKVREGSSALFPNVRSYIGYKYNPGRRTLCRNYGRIGIKKDSRKGIGLINQDQSANGLYSEQPVPQDEPDAAKNRRAGRKSRKPAKPRPLPKKRRHAEQNIPAASVLEADREEPSAKLSPTLSQAGDSLECKFQRRRTQKQKVREGSSALLPNIRSHLGYKYNSGRQILCRNYGRIGMRKESNINFGLINQNKSANGLDSEESVTQAEQDALKKQKTKRKSRKLTKPKSQSTKRRHAEQSISEALVSKEDGEEPLAQLSQILSQAGDSLECQFQPRRAQKQKFREESSVLLPKVRSHLGYKYNSGRRTLCRNCGRISMKKESKIDFGLINQDQSASCMNSETFKDASSK